MIRSVLSKNGRPWRPLSLAALAYALAVTVMIVPSMAASTPAPPPPQTVPPNDTPPPVAPTVAKDPPMRDLSVSFANGVTGLMGLTYAKPMGYRPLKLDLYLPDPTMTPPDGGFPLVVFVHGGAWMMGDRTLNGAFVDFPGVLASLAARGYVVASVSYRLSGEATFPAPISDIRAAIRWLRARADTYRMSPTKGMSWGVSAGGHLAALAAVGCHTDALDEAEPKGAESQVSVCLQGGVTWYGVFNLRSITQQAKALPGSIDHATADAAEWRELGCVGTACPLELLDLASPVTYVTKHTPPMLLMAGTLDHTVPHQQSVEMHDALDKAGVKTRLVLFPNVDHSFIGKTPDETRTISLNALNETFFFFDEILK